ncbi:MAG: glycoside hydrolase family 172 protein, partial [Candidatus Zipacnadales bacterium]
MRGRSTWLEVVPVLLLSGTSLLLTLNTVVASGLENLYRIKDSARTHRVSSTNPDPTSNYDFIRLKAGEKATICDIKGPGLITHIWFTYRVGDDKYANRNLVLRAWWDGEETPSVEVPIGDFFASGNGAYADVDSEPVQVAAEGRALNCFWPMPFAKRARWEVENQGPGFVDSFYYYFDYEELDEPPRPLATFHCQYHQEYPLVEGVDYLFADIRGRGQYVGTVLSWWSIEDGWPGEGDDRFYIDGEEAPSITGTGTEDYFNSAWGFRVVNRGSYGVTVWDGTEEGFRCTA